MSLVAARALKIDPNGRLLAPDLLGGPASVRLLAVLNANGEEARLVGGAVRNALLDLPPGDLDVTTTALPETVLARAKSAKLRAIPTGIAHGTVTVIVAGTPVEVTTLRQDVETDGRHAVVRFGRDFGLDAERRDFTINALSVSADGALHDVTGGVADLAAGRVRFIGEADRRIREDYLRILRFFRFSAAYATGPLDPEGLRASAAHRDALARLSRERIRAELLKLFTAPRAPAVVDAMAEAGVAGAVLSGPCLPVRFARLAAIEAARNDVPDAVLRLAALAIGAEADVRRLRDRLRLSNEEQGRLSGAVAARLRLVPDDVPGRAGLRELLFAYGERAALDGLDLAAADADPLLVGQWAQARAFVAAEPRPKLPLGGADVMARGVGNGRAVGAVLKRLQANWIKAGFPREPAALAALLDAAIQAESGGSG